MMLAWFRKRQEAELRDAERADAARRRGLLPGTPLGLQGFIIIVAIGAVIVTAVVLLMALYGGFK